MFELEIHIQFHQFYYFNFLLWFWSHMFCFVCSFADKFLSYSTMNQAEGNSISLKISVLTASHCRPPALFALDYCPVLQTVCTVSAFAQTARQKWPQTFTKVCVGKSQQKEVDWGEKKKAEGRNMEILEEEERLFDDFFGTQERIASSVMALC